MYTAEEEAALLKRVEKMMQQSKLEDDLDRDDDDDDDDDLTDDAEDSAEDDEEDISGSTRDQNETKLDGVTLPEPKNLDRKRNSSKVVVEDSESRNFKTVSFSSEIDVREISPSR